MPEPTRLYFPRRGGRQSGKGAESGKGGLLTRPSDTTRHAGPHSAVREKEVGIKSKARTLVTSSRRTVGEQPQCNSSSGAQKGRAVQRKCERTGQDEREWQTMAVA